ncbi:MAG: glycosyltransferase family 2 protein [Solirubrobacteraceae bacterium]
MSGPLEHGAGIAPGPRVSVVIPAWDAYAGPGLIDAVASVQCQDESAEVIVVDNASCVELPPLPGVKRTRLPQRVSTGSARNHGLGAATAPLVVFLDADDIMLPGALAELVQGITARPETVAHVMSITDGITGSRFRTPRRLLGWLAPMPAVLATCNAIWSLLPTQGCTIMRADDVLTAGGFDDSDQGEEWVLGASLAFRGRVEVSERRALLYHWRADSPGALVISGPVLLANARRVRRRLSIDPAIPSWVQRLLPAIAVAQWCTIVLVRPLVRLPRQLRSARTTPSPVAADAVSREPAGSTDVGERET